MRLPRERLDPEASDLGARLVARAAQGRQPRRGPRAGGPTRRDPEIAVFLFEDASTAVRGASMRALLDRGVDPNQLRALEDLVKTLSRLPVEAWEDEPVERRGYRGRRRRAGRAAARARVRGLSLSRSPSSESESEPESPPASPPARVITIRSGSTVTSTWRWSAQCSV